MRIHWIVDGIKKDPSGVYHASIATNRYRAIQPVGGLRARGHDIKLVPSVYWDSGAYAAGRMETPDIVMIGKIFSGTGEERFLKLSETLLNKANKASQAGATIIADINDDHFQHTVQGKYWRALTATVDGVVVGSPAMAEIVHRYCNKSIAIVGDPLGSQKHDPEVFRSSESGLEKFLRKTPVGRFLTQRLRVVWYGSRPSWQSMAAWSACLGTFASEQPLLIRVVTQTNSGIEAAAAEFNSKYAPSALMEFIAWDESTVWDVVRDSHIVFIPSDLTDASKSVKTANRLTDALYCGRAVVASPVPAYSEFGDYCWLGEDLIAGLRWTIAHPDEALDRIRRGQVRVMQSCSVDAISANWEEAFLRLLGIDSTETAKPTEPKPKPDMPEIPEAVETLRPVRLNLGCGDKLLEGYINVDVAPSRRGLPPDVLCDLRDLSSFASDSADEILSVHVVEHFWRWEVLDILREWVRVLKPGGKMILECPNLISACQELLSDPENASSGDARGQRSMWVFYGDPSWQDPLMTHRWAYTPNSLAGLLRESGLIDVRQQPAQFKLREPRDMRVVGVKPPANDNPG